jgi:integrase-like protein
MWTGQGPLRGFDRMARLPADTWMYEMQGGLGLARTPVEETVSRREQHPAGRPSRLAAWLWSGPSAGASRISDGDLGVPAMEPGSPSAAGRAPRVGDRARAAIRLRHLSPRTEEAYLGWMRRYCLFHGRRHPAELGAPRDPWAPPWAARSSSTPRPGSACR